MTVHLKPYWGKPAVRNFRGGRGNPNPGMPGPPGAPSLLGTKCHTSGDHFSGPVPRAGIENLAPRLATPFTLVYRCSKYTPKTATSATLGAFGAACMRQGSFGNTLQHHEIGRDMCWAGPLQNRVGIGAAKVPYQFPLIVHYIRLLTMAPDPHESARRMTLPCGRGSDSAHSALSTSHSALRALFCHAHLCRFNASFR